MVTPVVRHGERAASVVPTEHVPAISKITRSGLEAWHGDPSSTHEPKNRVGSHRFSATANQGQLSGWAVLPLCRTSQGSRPLSWVLLGRCARLPGRRVRHQLPNHRIKLPARRRSMAEPRLRSRAAAYAER